MKLEEEDGMKGNYSIKFDPESDLSYGCWFCPECGAEFYGPDITFHVKSCSRFDLNNRKDFSGLIYKYTRKEIIDQTLSPRGFLEKLKEARP